MADANGGGGGRTGIIVVLVLVLLVILFFWMREEESEEVELDIDGGETGALVEPGEPLVLDAPVDLTFDVT